MTTARKETYDKTKSGLYHCVARCVRRAFLCGLDELTGKSFEHRRAWIKDRLSFLLEVFAIDCIAYAVMSNHLHSLLRNLPELAASWTNEEVARRWRILFPIRRDLDGIPEEPSNEEIEAIATDSEKVELYRSRLCDISWFNRCMNENIARRANAEDACKGRFWEGRFKCQRLEGDAAIVACAAYIDLNPIRAGIAKTPEGSDFTSVQDRIRTALNKEHKSTNKLSSNTTNHNNPRLAKFSSVLASSLTTKEYLKLVDETGRLLVKGKANISPELCPILKRLGIKDEGWFKNAKSQSKLFYRVVGSLESLKALAKNKKRCWFKGLGAAKAIFV